MLFRSPGDGTSELVVIGRGLDRAEFEAAWAACLTPDPHDLIPD